MSTPSTTRSLIDAALVHRNLSIDGAAKNAGLHPNTVRRIRAVEGQPRHRTVKALADAIGLDPAQLYEAARSEHQSKTAAPAATEGSAA